MHSVWSLSVGDDFGNVVASSFGDGVLSLDAKEFEAESYRVGKKKPCPVNKIVGRLSSKDRKTLEGVLSNEGVSAGAVANVLVKHGHEEATHQGVRSHRKRTCSCFKA